MMSTVKAGIAVFLPLLAASLTPAAAAGVAVELNKLENAGESCRPYFMFRNATDEQFTSFKLDLFLVGKDEIIMRRVAVEAGPLRADKTTVRLFDVNDVDCGAIGRILVNDVISCAVDGAARQDCIALVEPSSRSDVELVK